MGKELVMRGVPLKLESFEDLHELAQRFTAARQNNDVDTQREILRLIISDEQECYQRKLKFLAELKTLGQEVRAAKGEAELIARLIELFRFSARLRGISYDELDDQETGKKATQATFDAAQQLKSIVPAGLVALTELLADPSVCVRCAAAIHVLKVIPDKAIPVLNEVEEAGRGTIAAVSAGFALRGYQREMARQP
jgi:hypothetical protein